MEIKELEALWEKTLDQAFEGFIRDNIGTREDPKTKALMPSCFGSGDRKSYCNRCQYHVIC